MNCRCLSLWETRFKDESDDPNLRQKLLSSFLAFKDLEILVINVVVDEPFIFVSDFCRFIYRTPISQSLKVVAFTLPIGFNRSLEKAIEYASSITILKFYFYGDGNAKYVYRYFRSVSLSQLETQNVVPEDCIALMRENRNTDLERAKFWGSCVIDSELVSKYVNSVLLREVAITHAYGTFTSSPNNALAQYLGYLFTQAGIKTSLQL